MLIPTPSTTITGASVGPSTHEGGGGDPSVKAQVLLAFNPVIEFFEKFRTNYQGVKTKKLHTLPGFQRRPHESLWDAYMWI